MVATFDSNIFMNGANARIQDRNNMMNTLSRLAYGMQEQKARRDEVRRREAKDAAEQARNPMNALIKLKQSGWDSLSSEEQAVLQAQDAMRTSEIGMNQWGQTYQKNNSILPSQTPGIVPQKSTYDTLAGPAPTMPGEQAVGAPSGGVFSTLAGPEPTYNSPTSDNPMANTPAGRMEDYKSDLKIREEEAKQNAQLNSKIQEDSFNRRKNAKRTLPILDKMIELNSGTTEAPFAEVLQPFKRLTNQDQAADFAQLRQLQLQLAAPLAKQLGVNPTDKDFQNTMDQIFNANESRETRDQQLKLLKQLFEGEVTPEGFTEFQSMVDNNAMPGPTKARAKVMSTSQNKFAKYSDAELKDMLNGLQ